jgi:hypothetical protein
VQDEARVGQQPVADGGGLAGGEVVADDVDAEAGLDLLVDLVQEVAEVGGRVLGGEFADDLAVGDVQGGEQVGGAVPLVVEAAPLGHSGQHREHRGGALQGLDLGFLVHAEDDRVPRRVEVDAGDVADLVDEERAGEILKVSARQGCRPKDRQICCTLVAEMPVLRASSRLDQCAEPSGTSSRVRTTTSSTWASVIERGTPGRGSPVSPSRRFSRNRPRQQATVLRSARSRAATATLLPPSAQASTIRARWASPCAVLRRFTQFSSMRRSSSDGTTGSSLISAMHPAEPSRSPAKNPSA